MPANRSFLPDPSAIHGQLRTFRAGCRCRQCDRTSRAYAEARRLDHLDGGNRTITVLARQPRNRPTGFVAGAGSARRLRGLVAIGYPPNQLAYRLGLLTSEVLDLLYLHRTGTVQAWKAANIAGLYDELWDQPQQGSSADRSRIVARREAWLPPLSWDDDVIDDPSGRPACRVEAVPGNTVYMPFSELEFLFSQDTPLAEILERGGYSDVETLKKRLRSHGRRDLLAKIPQGQHGYANPAGVPA